MERERERAVKGQICPFLVDTRPETSTGDFVRGEDAGKMPTGWPISVGSILDDKMACYQKTCRES